jgi:hypothetical protein
LTLTLGSGRIIAPTPTVVTRATAAASPRLPAVEAEFALRPGRPIEAKTGIAEPDRFAMEGVHGSKAAGARWALEREPALGVVEDALRQRSVDAAVPIGSEGVGRVLAHV